MLIELQTPNIGRWYWVSYPVSRGVGVRLVVTQMNPADIVGEHVRCHVFGSCDYEMLRSHSRSSEYAQYTWVTRRTGQAVATFNELADAKAWILAGVSRRHRSELVAVIYKSPFSKYYIYEPVI